MADAARDDDGAATKAVLVRVCTKEDPMVAGANAFVVDATVRRRRAAVVMRVMIVDCIAFVIMGEREGKCRLKMKSTKIPVEFCCSFDFVQIFVRCRIVQLLELLRWWCVRVSCLVEKLPRNDPLLPSSAHVHPQAF
jgi:hypothetical protein